MRCPKCRSNNYKALEYAENRKECVTFLCLDCDVNWVDGQYGLKYIAGCSNEAEGRVILDYYIRNTKRITAGFEFRRLKNVTVQNDSRDKA